MAQALLLGLPLWGAMIGFVVTLLVVFLHASVMGKLKIIIAGVLFLSIVLTTMPGRLIARYKTVADEEADDGEMDPSMRASAVSSTASRKQLLKHSLIFTMQHPLLSLIHI